MPACDHSRPFASLGCPPKTGRSFSIRFRLKLAGSGLSGFSGRTRRRSGRSASDLNTVINHLGANALGLEELCATQEERIRATELSADRISCKSTKDVTRGRRFIERQGDFGGQSAPRRVFQNE